MIHDCWNRIGVRGDSSCVELKTFVHCRNCSVYAAAAGELLDVELPPDYLAHWTGHIAKERHVSAPDLRSLIVFRVGAGWMALPTTVFEEVVDPRAIHTLPDRRGGLVLGIANVRGRLVVCVSLTTLLGLEAELDQTTRLLVLAWASQSVVCPVSEVFGVHHVYPGELSEPPGTLAKAAAQYTKAVFRWHDKSVALLDDALLSSAFERSLTSTAI